MPNNNKKKLTNNSNKKNNNSNKRNNISNICSLKHRKLLKITSFIIFYVSNILILMYVLGLEKEKCECSKEKWMRDFIKYFAMINLALPVLFLLMAPLLPNITSSLVKSKNVGLLALFSLLGLSLALLGLAYIVIVILYYIRLSKKQNCDCSLGPKRYFLLYPVVTFLLSLIGVFV